LDATGERTGLRGATQCSRWRGAATGMKPGRSPVRDRSRAMKFWSGREPGCRPAGHRE
jgi:hypothetical protein